MIPDTRGGVLSTLTKLLFNVELKPVTTFPAKSDISNLKLTLSSGVDGSTSVVKYQSVALELSTALSPKRPANSPEGVINASSETKLNVRLSPNFAKDGS